MRTILETLLAVLTKSGMSSSSECVREVSRWIAEGRLVAEFTADPAKATACLVEAIGTLMVLMGSRFHVHSDPATPHLFAIASGTSSDIAMVTTAETVAEVKALAAALGVSEPAAANAASSTVGGPLADLVLRQLLAYLMAQLPDLLEKLLEQLHQQQAGQPE